MRQQTHTAADTHQAAAATAEQRIAGLEAQISQRDELIASMHAALNDSAEQLRKGGELLQSMAASTRALAEIQRVLDPHGLTAATWVNIGEIYFGAQYYAEARQCFERALQEQDGQVDALNNLGVVHYTLGDLDAAETCFDQVLILDPEHALARENRAMLQA